MRTPPSFGEVGHWLEPWLLGLRSAVAASLPSDVPTPPQSRQVVGTDLSHAVVASTLLASIHIIQGSVVWTTAALLILAGIPALLLALG